MANKPTVNNERFEAAIQTLKTENSQAAQEQFIDLLIHEARFYSPMKIAGDDEDSKPAFAIVSDKEKHHYYALFTSKEKVKLWSEEETRLAVLSFRQLAGMCMNDPRISGVVININSDSLILGRKLLSDAVRVAASEEMEMTPVEMEGEPEFREPTGDFGELVDAIHEYVKMDPNVSAAYLRETTVNGEDCYAVIVSHIHGIQPTFANISTVAQDFGNGRPVAVVSARSKAAEKAIANVMPFYRMPFVVER